MTDIEQGKNGKIVMDATGKNPFKYELYFDNQLIDSHKDINPQYIYTKTFDESIEKHKLKCTMTDSCTNPSAQIISSELEINITSPPNPQSIPILIDKSSIIEITQPDVDLIIMMNYNGTIKIIRTPV